MVMLLQIIFTSCSLFPNVYIGLRKNFACETYRENIVQYMKSKQLPFTEKFICLAILSVNSVYKISEMYLSYSLNFTRKKIAVISVKWL